MRHVQYRLVGCADLRLGGLERDMRLCAASGRDGQGRGKERLAEHWFHPEGRLLSSATRHEVTGLPHRAEGCGSGGGAEGRRAGPPRRPGHLMRRGDGAFARIGGDGQWDARRLDEGRSRETRRRDDDAGEAVGPKGMLMVPAGRGRRDRRAPAGAARASHARPRSSEGRPQRAGRVRREPSGRTARRSGRSASLRALSSAPAK